MKADGLIFDLDGTLWNSTEAVARGWNNGAKKAGISRAPISIEEIENVCGRVWDECINILFDGFDYDIEEISPYLIEGEREAIEKDGGDLYPGVIECLKKLRFRYKLYIVSNCMSWYLKAFFDHSELGGIFQDFETHGATGLTKGENLVDLIKRNDLVNPVYIGDTFGDKDAADFASVPFYYASYGFGDLENEKNSFSSFRDLSDHFLNIGLS